MEPDEIPELEDFENESNTNSYTRVSGGVNNNTSGKCFDSQLDEDTRKLFKKALKKTYSKQKSIVHVEPLAADVVRSSATNNSSYPEWISEDLLARITSDPEIASWLQNPEHLFRLNKSHIDPTNFIKSMNAEENSNVIRKLLAILGEHFENLSIKKEQGELQEDSNQSKKPLIEEVLSSEEKELQTKAEELLVNDKVRNALMDAEVRKIVEALRDNSDKGQQLVAQASTYVKEKIHLLVQKGILAIQ